MKHGKHAKGTEPHMDKKLFAFVSAAAICCALVVGGTLAYFNAEEKVHNVITSGGVDIALNEWADLDKTKVVEVENIGESPAWIRVDAGKAVSLSGGAEGDASVVSMDFNTEFWTQGEDGYWYYNQALQAGQLTEPLFTQVYFAAHMGNEYQGSEAVVDICVQAVQSDNNSDSALTATGWPQA